MNPADLPTLENLKFDRKAVFLRLDLNVPLKERTITDDTRIQKSLPTIEYLLSQGAKLIIGSHLGRPKEDRKNLSLEPIGQFLSTKYDIHLIEDPDSNVPKALIPSLKENKIILLENLRFVEGETKNSEKLAKIWSSYSDIYINDAFGVCHRPHASVESLPKMMPLKAAGFLILKELKYLNHLMTTSKSPYYIVMGGSKIKDKIILIENLIDKIDGLIIGGAMSYTFLQAQGISIGNSLVDKENLSVAKSLIERLKIRGKSLYLPKDHIIATNLKDPGAKKITNNSSIPENWIGVDIGPKTQEYFSNILRDAKTVFWNGPMGIFETEEFAQGTLSITKALAESDGTTVVGGGDSAAAVNISGLSSKITHISTGGGASLEYLQGKSLPGLEALKRNR